MSSTRPALRSRRAAAQDWHVPSVADNVEIYLNSGKSGDATVVSEASLVWTSGNWTFALYLHQLSDSLHALAKRAIQAVEDM